VQDAGIDVVGAADDGVMAMTLAHELSPDVMILDLGMPGLGGAGVLERLRTELPEIRALVMSADERAETVLATVSAGGGGYLSKGTTGEELRQAVITTHGGGSVITPALAGHVLRGYAGGSPGGDTVRPLLAPRELEGVRSWPADAPARTSASSCTSPPAPCRTTSRACARRPACTGARRSPAGPWSTPSRESAAYCHTDTAGVRRAADQRPVPSGSPSAAARLCSRGWV